MATECIYREKNSLRIEIFLSNITVLDFDITALQRLITTHWAMNLKTTLRVKVSSSSLIPAVVGIHGVA